jgi:type VI secretion system protein ImpG
LADATAVTISPLMHELFARGHEFSFVQVMRLARRFLGPNGNEGLPEVPWQDRFRITPELSLAFPAADVARVDGDESALQVTATFMGLYGPSSPLPNFFTEDLMDEASSDESVIRDFVDFIHRRLYHLYFQCWSKYRLFVRVVEEKNPMDRERLLCLIGLGEKQLAESVPDAFSMLRYTGILTQFPRSPLGLRTILRDAFRMKAIRVIQNVKRVVPIPPDQRMRMGVSCCALGVDAVLGSEIADRMGKFRVEIGPLTWEEYDGFLPDTLRCERLAGYIRFYLTDPLDFDLKLILAAGEAKPLRLGNPKARLGLNMWCFSGDTLGEVSAVFPISALPASKCSEATGSACTDPPESERTLIDYYREERALLADSLAQFAQAHPNLAPMVSGPMADPGVEKLFEGTAFFNALLQRKLDDDIPEFIHDVIDTIQPEHLRPIPAATIVAFTPKPNCTGTQIIPAGTELDSVPVEGTACRFRTCHVTEVHPLRIVDAYFSHPSGQAPSVTLRMKPTNQAISNFRPKTMRFFLTGEHTAASYLYMLLTRFLHRIVITFLQDGSPTVMPANCLKPSGLGDHETILPRPAKTIANQQILQEYFLFIHKYMFVELSGLEKWKGSDVGTNFSITFELEKCPFGAPTVGKESFVLSATPAINLFNHRAMPLKTDKSSFRQLVRPAGKNADHYQIYHLDQISGTVSGTAQKKDYTLFNPLLSRNGNSSACYATREKSLFRDGFDTYLSLLPDLEETSPGEKLIATLTCTNGLLPERLGIGDICVATASTPESVDVHNMTPVTPSIPSSTEINRLWRILSALSLNCLSLYTPANLRSILRLFMPYKNRNQTETASHERRIEGVVGIEAKTSSRIISGTLYKGYEIRLTLAGDHFCSPGDMYLFSSVLERFFGGYVTDNCFTRLIVEDVTTGLVFDWPARLGDRLVL